MGYWVGEREREREGGGVGGGIGEQLSFVIVIYVQESCTST